MNSIQTLPASETPLLSLEVHAGDLLVCRASGSADLVGSAALVQECRPKLLLCDKLFRLHPCAGKASTAYLAAVLNSRLARFQIERSINGAEGLANNITQGTIMNVLFCLPPLDEQNHIISHIRQETGRMDGVVKTITQQVTKLREYRQTIISVAVTGKLAVVREVPS